MDKNKVKTYIEEIKNLNFKINSSNDLMLLEDLACSMEKYINGELSEEKLLSELDSTCPMDRIIPYTELCSLKNSNINEEDRCRECWKNALS